MRKDLIRELCEADRLYVSGEELNELDISDKMLDIILEEWRGTSFYDIEDDNFDKYFYDSVNEFESKFRNNELEDLEFRMYCFENFGVDISFEFKSIAFDLLDTMVEWDDISDEDLSKISNFDRDDIDE